jgi:hypothetical protein
MFTHRLAVLALGLAVVLPALCAAQAAQLQIPSLAPLQRDAVESVDVTLGPTTLGFIGFMSKFSGDRDPDGVAAQKVLSGLKSVQVRSFEFATDHAAAQASDVEALRAQLGGPGWRRLVQVRRSGQGENVDIYYVPNGDHTLSEMTILVSQPREFTLVHIVGAIDMNEIAMLRHTFAPDTADTGHRAF